MLVVVAGIPRSIGEHFARAFTRMPNDEHVRLLTWLTLDRSTPYSDTYAIDLYNRLADRLPKLGERIPGDVNLVLMYFDKCDGSHRCLIEQFGVEALVLPIAAPNTPSSPMDARNPRNRVVNAMIRNLRRAIKPVRDLLNVVDREVTSGDRKTWLLLPPKTFGDEIQNSLARAHAAARRGASDFREELRRVYRSMPRSHKHYQSRGCVFRPADRHARHGVPPSWHDQGHRPSCVIRGRLRLGVPYDPGFHYDCDVSRGISRFPGCHTPVTIRSRTYVNVAPNDHVR